MIAMDIEKAANVIKQGGLVAFPTETVYGLGADARSQSACLKIFQAKGRPSNNPLIVHVASLQDAKDIAVFNEDAEKLSGLWPGPLTLVLPQKSNAKLAKCVTAGLKTVAIRIPAEPTALNLIKQSGCPIAAPSANKSGTLSPTTYEHVQKNFGDEIFVLPSNIKAIYGLESTIIDLTSQEPTILRFGFITPEFIEKLLGKKIEIASKLSKIKAPGMLLKHYAPKTKLRLNASQLQALEVGLNFGGSRLNALGSMNLSPDADLAEAAANLFDYLHILDEFCQKNNLNSIAVSRIPNTGIGLAINDRLIRAAEKS
jgi:L-threonylcarbamoyladenylate synthase